MSTIQVGIGALVRTQAPFRPRLYVRICQDLSNYLGSLGVECGQKRPSLGGR
jgi:hypothetical protein